MTTFTAYLKKRRTLLIIWFCIHGIALFVNLCDIEGIIKDDYRAEIRVFTKQTDHVNEDGFTVSGYFPTPRNTTGYFWPFVKMYQSSNWKVGSSNQFQTEYIKSYSYTFNGLFYQYDLSEFIAYTILIFVFLYVQFNYKGKKQV